VGSGPAASASASSAWNGGNVAETFWSCSTRSALRGSEALDTPGLRSMAATRSVIPWAESDSWEPESASSTTVVVREF